MPIQYTISGNRITFPTQTYTNAAGLQVTIPETIAIFRHVSGTPIALATELNTIIDLFNRLPPSAALNMRSQGFVEFHFNRHADWPNNAGSWNAYGRWMDVQLVGASTTEARNQRLLTIAHELGHMYFGDVHTYSVDITGNGRAVTLANGQSHSFSVLRIPSLLELSLNPAVVMEAQAALEMGYAFTDPTGAQINGSTNAATYAQAYLALYRERLRATHENEASLHQLWEQQNPGRRWATSSQPATDDDLYRLAELTFASGRQLRPANFEELVQVVQYGAYGRSLGYLLGSTLGQIIADGDPLAALAGRALFSALGARLGQAIGEAAATQAPDLLAALGDAWQDVNTLNINLGAALQGAAVGTVSSLLAIELGDALGLDGDVGRVFGSVAGSMLEVALTNVTNGQNLMQSIQAVGDLFEVPFSESGAANILGSAIASFLAVKLGSLIVQPQTQAAVVLSSLGTAAGGWTFGTAAGGLGWGRGIGTAAANVLGGGNAATWFGLNVIAPGVGMLIGFVLGALIGNLFGRKKPRIPTANAEVYLQIPSAQYALGSVTQSGGGSVDLVRSMGLAARDTLNGLISVVTHGEDGARVSNAFSPSHYYGHTGSQLWVKYDANKNGAIDATEKFNVNSADEAVDKGILYALPATQIAGGDIFMKRALYNMIRHPLQVTSVTQIMGDLQIAEDYGFYLRNRAAIEELIAEPFEALTQAQRTFYGANEAFMARAFSKEDAPLTGADLTFYNANQAIVDSIIDGLQLTQFAAAWIITLQRAAELELHRVAPSDFYDGLRGLSDSVRILLAETLTYEDVALTIAEGELFLNRDANRDGRVDTAEGVLFSAPNLQADGGIDANFTATSFTSGSDFRSRMQTAPNTAVTLDDQSGGDDIFVGSLQNDTLRGGVGHDWLDGVSGADQLWGGGGNDVLLGRDGDDTLNGEGDDDWLYGGAGVDTLNGGAGNDRLDGGASGSTANIMNGGDGDDIFFAERGANLINGGNGSDTISYRYWAAPSDASWSESWEMFLNGEEAGVYRTDMTGNPGAGDDTFTLVENIEGSRFGDYIGGDAYGGANILKGLAGRDYLFGVGGNDTIEGGAGADFLNGGAGVDILSYRDSASAVWVDWTTGEEFGGDAEGDEFYQFEILEGSAFADTLRGDSANNILRGLGGDDWLIVSPGVGADMGNGVEEEAWGGSGFDTLDFSELNVIPDSAGRGVIVDLGYGDTGPQNFASAYLVGGGYVYLDPHEIEHVVGSDVGDSIFMSPGDDVVTGGGGNDILNGMGGSNTFVFYRGDGADRIINSTQDNTIVFGDLTNWGDIWATSSGGVTVGIRGTADEMEIVYGFSAFRFIDIAGAGAVDVAAISSVASGTDAANTLTGVNGRDWLLGHGGADTLRGAASGTVEQSGNLVVGGAGDDVIYTSNGDDQFAFDRGHGIDTIYDTGGENTLVLGPTVAAQDVITSIVGRDLFIGIRDLIDPTLEAHQVADRVRVHNGGTIFHFVTQAGGAPYQTVHETVQFIRVGGTDIDLKKLSLDWNVEEAINGVIQPIVFDLGGDGLDLTSIDASQVVLRGDDRNAPLMRVGWVDGQDGILALDRDGNGKITRASEISFVNDLEGAVTDLEGLRAYDSNSDGVFNAKDERWGDFRIWRDVNQNGRGMGAELMTLSDAGIAELSFAGAPTGFSQADTSESVALNTTVFSWANGETGTAYDVALAMRLAHVGGVASGGWRPEWSAVPSDGEFGRAVAADGRSDVPLTRVGLGELASAQDLLFEQADARDGQEPLSPIVQRRGSEADLEQARQSLGGAMPNASAGELAAVIVDIDGDGVERVAAQDSGAWRDLDADGWIDRLEWVGGQDAILVLDRDGDGRVSDLSELSFVRDRANGLVGSDELVAFDSDGDRALTAADARFDQFLLWTDANQDGVSQGEELRSLTEIGMRSLALTSSTRDGGAGELEVELASGLAAAHTLSLGAQSGLWLAWNSNDVDEGVRSAPYAASDEPVVTTAGPWALNADVRRILMQDTASGEGAPQQVASRPLTIASVDYDPPTEQAFPKALGAKMTAEESGDDTLVSFSPARTGYGLSVVDGEEFNIDAGPRRQIRRWWSGADVSKPSHIEAANLTTLMERLAPQSIVDRLGSASIKGEALPPDASISRQLDLLVQAKAALSADGGGEARLSRSDGVGSEQLTLPSAWRDKRVSRLELA